MGDGLVPVRSAEAWGVTGGQVARHYIAGRIIWPCSTIRKPTSVCAKLWPLKRRSVGPGSSWPGNDRAGAPWAGNPPRWVAAIRCGACAPICASCACPTCTSLARTLDFEYDTEARLQVVPRGQHWRATATGLPVPELTWTNPLGFVAMDTFGLADYFSDGLNEAGLSVGTLWLPETDLPSTPPDASEHRGAIDFVHLAAWLLGTCRTVADGARSPCGDLEPHHGVLAARGVQAKAPAVALLAQRTEHLSFHDAHGRLGGGVPGGKPVFHDNAIGVLTNSPTFDWHLTNLRNYVGLTNLEVHPVNLMDARGADGQRLGPAWNARRCHAAVALRPRHDAHPGR